MRAPSPLRPLLTEMFGTAALLVAVVGSGVMAAQLSPQNIGVALLANAIATGCALYVLITVLGPVSGAHINPAVTLVFWLKGQIAGAEALAYAAMQVLGGILGVWLAHAMFDLPILQVATTPRFGTGHWLAEMVATIGLILTILGGLRHAPAQVPALVAIYITGAYWFTVSSSFANPALTIARAFTDTPAGILPSNAPGYVAMQLIGAALAVLIARALFPGEPAA